jgi:hypothetical protein
VNANVTTTYYNTLTGNAAGTTTTTAGIQEAINSLPTGGGRVFLKAGIYTISATIKISPQSVILEGEGSPSLGGAAGFTLNTNITVLKAANSLNADMFAAVDSTTIRNLSLIHLGLEGNSANNTSGSAIDFSYLNIGNQSQEGLYDVRINDFKQNGLYQSLAGGATDVNLIVRACEISNCAGVGIGDSTPNTQINTSVLAQGLILISNGTNLKVRTLSQSYVDILSYTSSYAMYISGGASNNFIRIISVGDTQAYYDAGSSYSNIVQITATGDGSTTASVNLVNVSSQYGCKFRLLTKETVSASATYVTTLLRLNPTLVACDFEVESYEATGARITGVDPSPLGGVSAGNTEIHGNIRNTQGWFNGGAVNLTVSNPDLPDLFIRRLMGFNGLTNAQLSKFSATAGASPYTFPLLPYDAIYVITTVGGMTALTLDGQSLAPISAVGDQISVPANHTLIATWATTAPVFEVIPT